MFRDFPEIKYDSELVIDENLSLEELLHKIYFQGYKVQDVQKLLKTTLEKVKNVNEFFETLFTTVKNYAESVKKVRPLSRI